MSRQLRCSFDSNYQAVNPNPADNPADRSNPADTQCQLWADNQATYRADSFVGVVSS